MSLSTWFKSELNIFLAWFGVEESKVVTFAKPIVTAVGKAITDDLWADIEAGIPVVASALTGGIPAALAAAEAFLLPVLEKQGVALEQTALNLITNSLVAQAVIAAPTV